MASVPWNDLRRAAYEGNIVLAETLYQRDPDCFNTVEPPLAVGPVNRDGHQQFNIAIRNNRFEYIDFMLAHGGDINAGFARGNDLLRMVVRCTAEDEVTINRVKFLASRGAKVRESGALTEVVKGGSVELTRCLLDCGADVNGAIGANEEKPLTVAVKEGYEDIVKVLLDAGADVDAEDANCSIKGCVGWMLNIPPRSSMAPYDSAILIKDHQVYQTSKRPSDFVRSPLNQRTKAILTMMGFLCTVSWLSRTIIEIAKDLGYDITILQPMIAHLPKAFTTIGLLAPLIDSKDVDSMTANLGHPSNPLFVAVSIYCVPTILVALALGSTLAPGATEKVERMVVVFGPPALLLSHGDFRRWLSLKLGNSRKDDAFRGMAALEDDDFNCMTGM